MYFGAVFGFGRKTLTFIDKYDIIMNKIMFFLF